MKKYCGHLIIDSLFLHYGRAQRPQLRLRPLCAHKGACTHQARQSLPREPSQGWAALPVLASSTTASPSPASTTVNTQQGPKLQFQRCFKDASFISQSHTYTGVLTSSQETVPWL